MPRELIPGEEWIIPNADWTPICTSLVLTTTGYEVTIEPTEGDMSILIDRPIKGVTSLTFRDDNGDRVATLYQEEATGKLLAVLFDAYGVSVASGPIEEPAWSDILSIKKIKKTEALRKKVLGLLHYPFLMEGWRDFYGAVGSQIEVSFYLPLLDLLAVGRTLPDILGKKKTTARVRGRNKPIHSRE
jgi:hypothetical protein